MPRGPVITLTPTATSPLSVRAKAMVFEDPASRALLARIARIAPSDAPVLVTGETGTGKELVARQLHALSGRVAHPFVAVNAGAFSEQLIESELFGHGRGAFTGAHAAKPGWSEAAHGGTLFLDEIGDLPLPLQVKLLRVLQEGEVTRLGSRTTTAVNVRLIAATNVDLRAAIRARNFREDLFYRLQVTSLVLPPLRARPGDILPLARYFLDLYAGRLGKVGMSIGASAHAELHRYAWPGNIRELENAIHHALLVCEGRQLEALDLQLPPEPAAQPPLSLTSVVNNEPLPEEAPGLPKLTQALIELLDLPALHQRVEAALLSSTYRYCGQNQLETARRLGMSRNVVRARLIEIGELKGALAATRLSRTGRTDPTCASEHRERNGAAPHRLSEARPADVAQGERRSGRRAGGARRRRGVGRARKRDADRRGAARPSARRRRGR